MKKIDNKWKKGKINFSIPPMKEFLGLSTVIYPTKVVLDKDIGLETCLFLLDETDFIYELATVKPFTFFIKIGVAKTSYGPVCFVLYYVMDTEIEGKIFYLYEQIINPNKKEFFNPFYEMAKQSCVHLFLVDKNFNQQGFFEFKNTYNFEESFNVITESTKNMIVTNFELAKEEYKNTYTVQELLSIS